MNWVNTTLGEITVNIQTGPFGSQLHQSDYIEAGIPVVMPKDLINGHIDENTIARVQEEHVERLRKHKISKGDILYPRRGDIGKCAFSTDKEEGWLCGTGCLRVTIDETIANPKFVFYQLFTNETKGWIEKHAIGATMLNLNTSILERVPIVLPEMRIQNSIANILSNYDTLIENNQKQIKLLEEAAQRLYKEWFVDLRFPGHEQTRIVDGVPEGWKRKTVKDCLEYHINGGWGKDLPTSNNRFKGEVIRGTDIQDIKGGRFSDIPIRYHSEKDIVKRILKKYDIIFELSNGNINSIGRTLLLNENILNICGENTICASFCKLLRPINYIHSLILYWEIQDMQLSGRLIPFKKQGANGINNFAFEDFLQHSLLITEDKNIIKMFDSFMQKISVLQNQLFLLTEARDRLLPKLMNGEIEL